ncbi:MULTISPECIES: DUF6612 family protein [Bacillus]|uniref:DUF6612 family protein n=1 Tax=Bacillus TaxID=1386 RepID=UPI0003313D5A|nr:DUF6612 family protein [Bacillus wiedmannii]EOQ28884.1 hypothetical protein KQ1_03135 [Bacillus cereus BAG3O-1]MBJ8117827.1 hypothetical protein [Bacillus cereus]RFB15546.1 hypothetical protein DZB88_00505 [Bacillus sp. OE]RFB21039.1 hypothetical protein DZB85_24325 [Bacillus sp. LB(2018)]RFB69361.1 hypothetical protein DZB94_25405 [Bacillus sp. AW]HDR8169023.1 hypothetical protein [Bacillus thuringiensis]
MKKMIIASSLALIVGLTSGCSSEKTNVTKPVSVQKEKELVAKDIFKKAGDKLKQEEFLTLTSLMSMKGNSQSEEIKMNIQMEPKRKNSRAEMKISGTDIITYEVDEKVAVQVKDPNTGELVTIPNDQFNVDDVMVSKNLLNELDLPEALAKKMKAKKDGDTYKLTLDLKGKEAVDTLQKINGDMKKLTEGFNMDALTVEYIITKDYKFEEMRTAIKLSERNTDKKSSADKEKLDTVVSIKIDSYDKFDPIKLPEGSQ